MPRAWACIIGGERKMFRWSPRSLSLSKSRLHSSVVVSLALSLLMGSVLVAGVPSAWAGSATYSGTLGGGPTYNRVIHSFTGAGNCNQLAGAIGDAVFYHAQPFTVDTTGLYDML